MRNIVILALITALILSEGCSKGRFDEIKTIMIKVISVQEAYISAIKKADNAVEISDAIEEYAVKMEKLNKDMNALQLKYPEITKNEELPDELKEINNKMEMTAMKMAVISEKITEYDHNIQVQKAKESLFKANR